MKILEEMKLILLNDPGWIELICTRCNKRVEDFDTPVGLSDVIEAASEHRKISHA